MSQESPNPPAHYLPNVRRLRGEIVSDLETMQPAIEFIPAEIANARMYCQHCRDDVPVPLEKLFPEPPTPVFPTDYHPVTNNKFWQMQGLELDCPQCGRKTKLTLPTRPWTKSLTLYGDEAIRQDLPQPFFCLSLVGGSQRYVDNSCTALRNLKQQLEPTRNTDHWRFHMTDLHSGHKRKRHPIFALWDREKVAYAIRSLFQLVESANKELFVFVLIYLGNTKGRILQIKTKAYMALLLDMIYTFTRTGVSPSFVLDAEKNVHGETTVIQNWARRAFLGSERQLRYVYFCHGVPVPEPQFVRPGSHPCLELADFVSFVAARELFCYQKQRGSEYPTEQLGRVVYSWVNSQGYTGWGGRSLPCQRILAT